MTQDLELAVHTSPGERPVLLIHGFTRSAELDWIEPGWLTALAAQGRGTIAVDLPGHGSCPPADPGAVSVNAIIAAMVAAIDSTGQELADVVGYSLGARLAWTLTATGRVGRLVLGGLSPTDTLAGVDIDLVGAIARGDAEAPDPETVTAEPLRDQSTSKWLALVGGCLVLAGAAAVGVLALRAPSRDTLTAGAPSAVLVQTASETPPPAPPLPSAGVDSAAASSAPVVDPASSVAAPPVPASTSTHHATRPSPPSRSAGSTTAPAAPADTPAPAPKPAAAPAPAPTTKKNPLQMDLN